MAFLNPSVPSVLLQREGGALLQFTVLALGAPLTGLMLEGRLSPVDPWVVLSREASDYTHSAVFNGHTTSDGSNPFNLSSGAQADIWFEAHLYTEVRLSATGPLGGEATCTAQVYSSDSGSIPADQVSFAPTPDILSTDVQAAIQEVESHIPDLSNAVPLVASATPGPGTGLTTSRYDHQHPTEVDNAIGSSSTRAPSQSVVQAAIADLIADKEQASTALLSGGAITINADPAKVDITAITARFVTNTPTIDPTTVTVTAGPFTAVAFPNIASQPGTYIGLNSSGALVLQNTVFTSAQRRSIAVLGLAIHSNNVVVNAINQLMAPALQSHNQLLDLVDAVGPLNLSGNDYSANGANLSINKSAGVLFKLGAGYPGTPASPNQVSLAAGTAITFRYRRSNSVEGANVTLIDPTQYESAPGVLSTLSAASNYSVQRIYVFQSGLTRIQYGQAQYNTMADAINGIRTEPFVVEPNMAANGIFRGFLVLRRNATNLTDSTQAAFFSVSKFGASQLNGAGSVITGADIITALGYTPENAALKGAANGYAPLNASALVPIANGGLATNGVPVNGQIPIGNGTGYSVANLTAGANITITNGAGSITIASTGGGGSFDPTLTQSYGGTSGNESVKIIASGTTGTNYFQFQGSTGVPIMSMQGASADITWLARSKGASGFAFQTGAGKPLLTIAGVASAVNGVTITPSIAGGAVAVIGAAGDDTNITTRITAKGNGAVTFAPNGTTLMGVLNTGELRHFTNSNNVVTASGILGLRNIATGSLPSAATEGAGAIVRDSTTNQLKMSDGSAWNAVGGGGGLWVMLGELAPSGSSNTLEMLASFDTTVYEEYYIQVLNLRPAVTNTTLSLNFAISGVVSGASQYYDGTAGATDSAAATFIALTTGNALSASNGSQYGWNGGIKVSLRHGWFSKLESNLNYSAASASVSNEARWGAFLSGGGTLTGFRLTAGAGNFDGSAGASVIRLYGLKKA